MPSTQPRASRPPPPFRLALYETPSGRYWLPADTTTDIVVDSMAKGEVYDAEIVAAAKECIVPGTVVLDVGACFGQMSVLFARMAGEAGRVHAFEASPQVCELLRRNVAENDLVSRIVVHEAAVWSEAGKLVSYPYPDWSVFGSYGSFGLDPRVPGRGWQLHTSTIDDLAIEAPISFMKVDVQGSDLAAMQGAERTIRKHRMPIVFEYEKLLTDRFGDGLDDYLRFVASIGYRVERVIGEFNYLIVAA